LLKLIRLMIFPELFRKRQKFPEWKDGEINLCR